MKAVHIVALLLVFATMGLLSSQAFAQTRARPVVVSVHILPPFVETHDNQLSGFSIDLWNAIAQRRQWQTIFLISPDVTQQLASISDQTADVGVGAISITAERDIKYDFSQPMLHGGLQILALSSRAGPESTALISLLHLLFSPAVLVWLGIAGLLTIIPAHIVWFVERGHPDGIISGKNYFPGIFQAFFWGLGTLATQADSMPRHWVSRTVAILWMFTSVVFVAFYTATLTATLTVAQFKSEINGPADLPGKTVATIAATTSSDYLWSEGINFVSYTNIEDAYKALVDKRVDAVVFDAPVLRYLVAHKASGVASVVGTVFHAGDYGFAFRNGSDLRKQVDATLLSMREDGSYDRLAEEWFGKR